MFLTLFHCNTVVLSAPKYRPAGEVTLHVSSPRISETIRRGVRRRSKRLIKKRGRWRFRAVWASSAGWNGGEEGNHFTWRWYAIFTIAGKLRLLNTSSDYFFETDCLGLGVLVELSVGHSSPHSLHNLRAVVLADSWFRWLTWKIWACVIYQLNYRPFLTNPKMRMRSPEF